MTTIYQEKDKIDYGAVINVHLMRITKTRTKVMTWSGTRTTLTDIATGVKAYFYAVDTLYNILLPELRGRAREYLDLAIYLIPEYECYAYNLTYSTLYPSYRKEYEEMSRECEKEYLRRLEENLPEGIEVNITPRHRAIVELIDMALKEMLIKLNEAGLLMRGIPIKVGHI